MLSPEQLSLTDQTGRSVTFQRCRPAIPATASATELLRGRSARHTDGADANLPFASQAGLHAFLVPDLADTVAHDATRVAAGGRIDAASCLQAEPITGAQDDYAVSDVVVSVPASVPERPDRTSGTVSVETRVSPPPCTSTCGEPRRAGGSTTSIRSQLLRCLERWRPAPPRADAPAPAQVSTAARSASWPTTGCFRDGAGSAGYAR